jgi:hypothetical protein
MLPSWGGEIIAGHEVHHLELAIAREEGVADDR